MMKRITNISCWLLVAGCWLFSACQKEIAVDLPDPKIKICVEGKIEPGFPPYVILTHNMRYFGPTDLSSIENLFIHDAVITVSNGISSVTLTEYCSQSIPSSLLPVVGLAAGLDTTALQAFNFCLYTTLDTNFWGKTGQTYQLTVDAEGKHLTSTTSILNPVPLDSTWAKYYTVSDEGDSLGFVYGHLTDPPGAGNSYRWLAMRLGKDASFLAPMGAPFDDKFIEGQSFDFGYNRPIPANKPIPDDELDEAGYYKAGDTVIVKFCTIDRSVYEFYRQLDVALSSQGNPFAAPTSVPSNVYPRADALGVWCGYGTYIDTVIFK